MAQFTLNLLNSLKLNLQTLQALKERITRLNENYKNEYSAMLAGSKHAAKAQRLEIDDRHKQAINKAINSSDNYDLMLLPEFKSGGESDTTILDRVKQMDQFAGELFQGKAKGVNRYIDLLISEHLEMIKRVEANLAG